MLIRLQNTSNRRQKVQLSKQESFVVDAGAFANFEPDAARRMLREQPEAWALWIPSLAQVASGKRIGGSRTALSDLGLTLDDFELAPALKRALAEAMTKDLADMTPEPVGVGGRRTKISKGRAKAPTQEPEPEPAEPI
jgi:hypothetical protein